MGVCCCALAGTAACQHCSQNPNATDLWTNAVTTDNPNFVGVFMFKPQEEKLITNFGRLHSMNEEELAHWIEGDINHVSEWCAPDAPVDRNNRCLKHDGNCWMCALDWLKQEAKGC